MPTVTISPKYQVVIPEQIRNALGLKPGMKVQRHRATSRPYRGLPNDFRELGRSGDRSTPKRAGRGSLLRRPGTTPGGRWGPLDHRPSIALTCRSRAAYSRSSSLNARLATMIACSSTMAVPLAGRSGACAPGGRAPRRASPKRTPPFSPSRGVPKPGTRIRSSSDRAFCSSADSRAITRLRSSSELAARSRCRSRSVTRLSAAESPPVVAVATCARSGTPSGWKPALLPVSDDATSTRSCKGRTFIASAS